LFAYSYIILVYTHNTIYTYIPGFVCNHMYISMYLSYYYHPQLVDSNSIFYVGLS